MTLFFIIPLITEMQLIGERAKQAGHYQGRQMEIGDIYIYMVSASHFSSAGPVLRNVVGVKCEPFLKHSNYW